MASEISKLAVVLTANAGGLAAGLKQGETALAGIGAAAQRASGVFSGLTGVLGAVGVGFSLWAGLGKAGEAEQAVSTLNGVIRATGAAAGFSSEQLQGYAAELAASTAFSKGAAVAAETVLSTFTNIRGDQFKEALKVSADLAQVMGTDLRSAATAVGRAMENPTNAAKVLKRAHVELTQAQTEQIAAFVAAGNQAAAQGVILDALRSKVGGVAEEVGRDFSVQIDKAKASVGSIATVIAGGMLPPLAAMAKYLKSAAEWAKAHKSELQALGKGILVVVGAIAVYKTVVFAITAAQKAWALAQAGVLALQGPKGWLQLAAAGLITLGAYKAIDAASEKAGEAMGEADAHMAAARQQMNGLGEDGEDAADGVEATGKAAKKLADHAKEATDRLREQILTFGMSAHAAEVYKLQTEGVTAAQLEEADMLARVLDGLEKQKKAAEEAAAAVNRIWEDAVRDAERYIDDIRDPFEKLADELERIGDLEAAGLLTAGQAEKAAQKAAADAIPAGKGKEKKGPDFAGGHNTPEKVAALERRFTRGFQADNNRQYEKMLAEQTATRKATERNEKNTRKLADKAGEVVSL